MEERPVGDLVLVGVVGEALELGLLPLFLNSQRQFQVLVEVVVLEADLRHPLPINLPLARQRVLAVDLQHQLEEIDQRLHRQLEQVVAHQHPFL